MTVTHEPDRQPHPYAQGQESFDGPDWMPNLDDLDPDADEPQQT